MSTYESDPNDWKGDLNDAGLSAAEILAALAKEDPVGKRYGAKDLGRVGVRVKCEGVFNEAVIEIRKTEVDALADVLVRIPPYSQITEIWVEVTEAFGAADTFDLEMDGNDINNVVVPVGVVGIFPITVSTVLADLQSGATEEDLTVDGALLDFASTAGVAKATVRYITM